MAEDLAAGTILVAEDDKKTASLIALYLQRAGFSVLNAEDGESALRLVHHYHPRLVILDLVLPRIDGWQVCREIRNASDVPIIILSSREQEMDRVLGLTLGADDYVVKPFSPREVVARVQAVLRRSGPSARRQAEPLAVGALRLDAERRRVWSGAAEVHLTPAEFTLLEALMGAPGRVFSRAELLDCLYPEGDAVIDRVIDVHVGKIRQKIEPDPTRPKYILTVRGFGYKLCESDADGA